jgi:plasmid stability protein
MTTTEPKRGRPPLSSDGQHSIRVRLPLGLYDELYARARELHKSNSDLVRDILSRSLAASRRRVEYDASTPASARPAPPAVSPD